MEINDSLLRHPYAYFMQIMYNRRRCNSEDILKLNCSFSLQCFNIFLLKL